MPRSPWLLLLILPACGALQRPVESRSSVSTLDQLKTDPKGVCARVVDLNAEPWSVGRREETFDLGGKMLSSTVQACARIQPGAGDAGEGAVIDVSLVFPKDDEHWRPEYWHVEVIRGNGMVIDATNLGADRIEDGVCVLGSCNKEGYATVAMPEPWKADRYRVRLTHVPTRKRVELVITLN